MLTPEAHLERVAGILRRQIGPAVGEPFPRTQAFMAAVVLEKLARQLATAADHAAADQLDMARLRSDLLATAGPGHPDSITAAIAGLGSGPDGPALSGLVAALYAHRETLGPDRFEALLGRVRQTMRARLDRQLEYSA